MTFINKNADTFGAFSSILCLVHCIATPFVFIVQSCTVSCCNEKPLWWQSIDYVFLAISFIAIKQTIKQTSCNWMKPAFWFCWALLFIAIINEKLAWLPLGHSFLYFPSITLAILHIYNLKYCKCNNKCCSHE